MKDTKIKLGMVSSRIGKVIGLKNADGDSISGQLRSVSINSLDKSGEIFEVQAKIIIHAEDIEQEAKDILPNGSYSYHA